MENYKISCHSSTSKQELLDFAEKHKNRDIQLHYESNMYDKWGDDYLVIFKISEHKDLLEYINKYYIHSIETI